MEQLREIPCHGLVTLFSMANKNTSKVSQDINPQDTSVEMNGHMKTVQCCDWQQKYYALEKRMARMQKEMAELKERLKKDNTEVRNHCQHFYQSENSSKIEFKELKDKVDILSNVVIRMEEQAKIASQKLLDLQTRSMRKNLIISGLEESRDETPDQLLETVRQFIAEKLKVQEDVQLKTAHRLNYQDGSECKPVVFKLKDVNQKSLLLSHGPNLRGMTNNKGKHFYLNEQLPDRYAEDRRYAQHWIKQNKSKPVNDQMQMKIYKNKLRINNEPYQKKVSPPSAAEILRLDPAEIQATNKAPTVFGDTDLIQGSEFISYAAKVKTIEEVRVAYRKLRVRYPDASHIVSAFRLNPPNGPFNQEASDDGEHAGGRCILNVLEEQGVVDVAVFIIRFYGGTHIGAVRFDVIRKLSIRALQRIEVVSSSVVPHTGRVNRATTRRQTRSMSQSVRGKRNTHSGSYQRVNTHAADIQAYPGTQLPTFSPSFRTTPLSSPVVSPTHVRIGLDGDFLSAEEAVTSQQSQSEYEDLHTEKDESDTGGGDQSPHEADDEDDEV